MFQITGVHKAQNSSKKLEFRKGWSGQTVWFEETFEWIKSQFLRHQLMILMNMITLMWSCDYKTRLVHIMSCFHMRGCLSSARAMFGMFAFFFAFAAFHTFSCCLYIWDHLSKISGNWALSELFCSFEQDLRLPSNKKYTKWPSESICATSCYNCTLPSILCAGG